MKKNTAIITGLFMLMILAFTVDPTFIYNFENNLLGKAVIILVLIYLTMNSVTLGLLFALVIIIISNKSMIEGMKNRRDRRDRRDRRNKRDRRDNRDRKNKKDRKRCKTLQELLREERNKKMRAKAGSYNIEDDKQNDNDNAADDIDEIEDEIDITQSTTDNKTNMSNNSAGVDRLSLEETFRVRNPSTIPVTKEAFSVRELSPFDNVDKYYGGACSLI